MSEPAAKGFIVIADIESLLNVLDAGMLPKLAALGVDIVIPRPVYNRLLPSSTADEIDSLTPPIRLIGPDEQNRRLCRKLIPLVVVDFMRSEGRARMEAGEAGVLIVPRGDPWFSPRRLGNLRTLLVDSDLDLDVERHFRDVADGQRGYDDLIKLLSQAPDVPPDPGDEMPD